MQAQARSLTDHLDPKPRAVGLALLQALEEDTRAHVAAPLFSARSAAEFDERLSDALAYGAAVRHRFLQGVWVLPEPERTELLTALLEPPDGLEHALRDLARDLLGDDEFMLVRALQLAQDVRELGPELLASIPREDVQAGLGQLAADAGAHEALYIAWVLLLIEQVPAPVPEVARAAAAAFLRLGEARRASLKRVLHNEPPEKAPAILIDHVAVEQFFHSHPSLVPAFATLLSIAASDDAVERVTAGVMIDREVGDRWLSVSALVAARDLDRVDELLCGRALRAGVLSASDEAGGVAILTVRPA